MSAMNPEQFRMQTNMKASPNSQGTLFQGGKPVDAHRYPRGYTPERMRAVTGALSLTTHVTEPPRNMTESQARAAGATDEDIVKGAPHGSPETMGVAFGPRRTVHEHTIKNPAEQVAATKGKNRTVCPTCKGAKVLKGRAWGTAEDAPGEHCFACGGYGEVGSTHDYVKKGKGWVGLREAVQEGHEVDPKVSGHSGLWDESEIIPDGHHHPFLNPQGDLHIREAIARSTVPVSDIALENRKVRRIRVSHDQQMKNANAAGHARYGEIGLETHRVEQYRPSIGTDDHYRQREEASSTLIHELGHTSGAMGTDHDHDEARADAYMLQHYRPDPRNVRRGVHQTAGWLYSGHAGDSLDPDNVHAPGETDAMKQERLVRAPAANYRRSGGRRVAAARFAPPKQLDLF